MALVRAPRSGDGPAVALLWRELWDLHTEWGGYAGSKEDAVYMHLERRLESDFRHRREAPIEGSHIHLVAEENGRAVGQVEGWLENYGEKPETPVTCEVRSLVVSAEARGGGIGRQLLEALARVAYTNAGRRAVLVAEVLDRNPALAFYLRAGFVVGAFSRKLSAPPMTRAFARPAGASDAFSVARFAEHLAGERRLRGDLRFDPPAALDAARVSAVATYLRQQSYSSADHIAFAPDGTAVGTATLCATSLDPPFLPQGRAALGRFALSDTQDAQKAFGALVASAWQDARAHGAAFLELTELVDGRTPTLRFADELGAQPWSTIVMKTVDPA